MRPSLYLRYVLWESRGSWMRLFFFVACLAVGVAAIVAVASLSSGLEGGIRSEARQLLAADLAVSGRRPLPPELDDALRELPGARRADVRETVTIVAAPSRDGQPGRSQLVELKAVGPGYPFYGALELDPPEPLASLLGEETVLVAPELLLRLGLERGDRLRVGAEEFRIAGTVSSEPDRIMAEVGLGPRVLLHLSGLERANLVQYGSRVSYRALIRLDSDGDDARVKAAAEELKRAMPESDYYRVETFSDAQPRLRRGLSRLDSYLGLVALLSLLVGGVGVAQTIRAWLAGRLDSIAVLKCLGMRPREILGVYLGQAVALGVVGSLIGALLGSGVALVLPQFLGAFVPTHLLRLWQPWALLRGLLLGVGVAFLFTLPALTAVLRVAPSRVLRRDAEPLAAPRWAPLLGGVVLVGGISAMAVVQSGSFKLGAQFVGGVLATTLALVLASLGLVKLAGSIRRDRGGVWIRHGLAALGRPGAATTGATVALGLGLCVVLTTVLVEIHLSDQLGAELPANAPSAFLIDVQPDQWRGVQDLLTREGATGFTSVPVIMARLTSIDGRDVRSLVKEGERRWALTREQRLTYLEELPSDNEIVQGALWSDPERPEVSLEEEFARELGVGVGSTLEFDIQGIDLELAVTSVRRVEWESMGINFYLVVEPGVLEEAPQMRLAAARLPMGKEQSIQDLLSAGYPNVTLLRLGPILEKLQGLLHKLAWGVRFLGAFTVVAGIVILAGTVAAAASRRGREVALLKTLGMTRGNVLVTFATEYALVGVVAGAIATLGGGLVAWFAVTQRMELPWQFHPLPLVLTLASGVALSVGAGILASAGALRRRPAEVLRQE